ncbi:DUF6033 family protein [Parablautia muri]|uniref:Uncharacterized protein n=1 Tax=Parablautia muri TaxID=2320879 RepID=A0A9X5BJ18_9FIRM|nr:DUF6033 family protein [Parablautia muri]NBJ94683.1 hypothetical protein [Parablautia muri]
MSILAQVESNAQAIGAYEESKTSKTSNSEKKPGNYGRTIGQPELSEKAQKYYEELKKKFSNMDFILVSSDMKAAAKAQAGRYANPNKMVVLIDEEKIEKMADDENFRKQYEGVIRSAGVKLPQLQKSLGSNASKVKSFGMQINDGGNASFFAVVDKSLAAQRVRIKKNAEKKAKEKKETAKKEAKEAAEEKLTQKHAENTENADTVTVTASSIEELIKKINDVIYEGMSDSVLTDAEKMIGQRFDSRW